MIKRILVPLDGSQLAEGVLPTVMELAKPLQAEVYFIQVVSAQPQVAAIGLDAGALLSPELLSEELEAQARAAESYLSSLADNWRANGVGANWKVVREVVGRAAGASIVAFAHAHHVDAIAMSTHGRSGLSRLIFGSVAEEVVREAGTPVLLVKPDQKTAKRS